MSYSTTFKASNKAVEQVYPLGQYYLRAGILSEIPTELAAFKSHHCTEVLQGSLFPDKVKLESNGFVKTVVDCYNRHHNLVIRPDDVWTAIMVQFSFYINKEAKKFRKKFVSHEGQKELVVIVEGTLRTAYSDFVKQMSEQIDKNLVDRKVKDWLLPSFSTTTEDDRVVCGVVLMAAMKKYFKYTCRLMCGIPNVTLEGTLKDWENIKLRLKKLKEYELGWWYKMLKPILQQFIKAKKGKPQIDFWQKVCHHFDLGSGPTYLSGWITAFCVFDSDGNQPGLENVHFQKGPWPVIEDQNIPTGSVEVDVKIDDNGTTYHSVMFAGHMAQALDEDFSTLRPITGWVICLKPNPEEQNRLDKEEGRRASFHGIRQ